jgi:hypothetical protein
MGASICCAEAESDTKFIILDFPLNILPDVRSVKDFAIQIQKLTGKRSFNFP